MKKLLCLLLALVMVLSLAACAQKDDDNNGGGRENMSWRELMEEGRRLLEEGAYDDAIDVLSDAIDQRDTRSDLYVLRGQAYLGKGSSSALKKAVKDFEAALEISKDYEEAWVGLVKTLMEQEELGEALERAREGLEVLGKSRELEKLCDKIEDELGASGHETEPGYETHPGSEPEPTAPAHVHSWTEANYQEPRRCAECGETAGDPLTPDFERYGIYTFSCANSIGVPYVYQTACYESTDVKTLGFLTLTDYKRFGEDDTHPFQSGYEWRVATFRLQFSDENAKNYGYQPAECQEDYYSITLNDESIHTDSYGNQLHSVSWNGKLYEVLTGVEVIYNQWDDNVATVILRVDVLAPIDYDGVVYGFYDSSTQFTTQTHINQVYNETFLLFRFD